MGTLDLQPNMFTVSVRRLNEPMDIAIVLMDGLIPSYRTQYHSHYALIYEVLYPIEYPTNTIGIDYHRCVVLHTLP